MGRGAEVAERDSIDGSRDDATGGPADDGVTFMTNTRAAGAVGEIMVDVCPPRSADLCCSVNPFSQLKLFTGIPFSAKNCVLVCGNLS